MQLRKCRVRFTKLSHVFITHLHGDHCFGLIGMISTFGLLGRTAKLHIHGPKELGPELDRQIKFYTHDLGYEVVFYPVDTTKHQVIYEDRSLTVESIPLEHRMPCCGYLIREKQNLPHIRRDVARDAGVGKLMLGHYSSRYEDETVLLQEARSVFENSFLSSEKEVIDV